MSLLKYVFFYRQPIHSNEDVQYIKSECITLCPPSTSSTEVTILTFRGCCCHQDEAYLWTNSLILIFSSFVLLSVLTVSLHLRSKSSSKKRGIVRIFIMPHQMVPRHSEAWLWKWIIVQNQAKHCQECAALMLTLNRLQTQPQLHLNHSRDSDFETVNLIFQFQRLVNISGT